MKNFLNNIYIFLTTVLNWLKDIIKIIDVEILIILGVIGLILVIIRPMKRK